MYVFFLKVACPNITGHIAPNVTAYDAGSPASGSFVELTKGNPYNAHGAYISDNTGDFGYDFNAARSSPIYGKSQTVQPSALSLNYVIKA